MRTPKRLPSPRRRSISLKKSGCPKPSSPSRKRSFTWQPRAKSNASALAIWTASKDVKEGRTLPVPKHLRDTHYQGSKRLGHGEGYRYSHDFPGGIVEQDYLGVDKIYYDPVDRGYEAEIRKRMGPRKDSQPTEQQGGIETNPPGSADVT